MSLRYRPVPDDDVDEFRRLLTYAFRPTDSHEPLDDGEELPSPEQVGARRGVYDGADLLCTGRHHWFTMNLRGSKHEVPGLSAVSTPPWNRRRGLVRRLLRESLEEYRERECWFSVLWPFEHPFYATFGWATTTDYGEISVAPDDLDFVDDVDPTGEFVELDADRWADCEAVYREANDHTLAMYRTEEWWRKRVFQGWQDDPYVAGVEREVEGEETLVGYVVYRFDEDGDDRTLKAYETCAVDHDAYVELLRFCRYHDSQAGSVELYGRPDTDPFDLVTDPRDVSIELHPGPMVRLVDVERGLSALDYPGDAGGSVTFAVEDDLVPWNDGAFRLAVEGGRATCEPAGDASDATDADVELGVGALSQLAVGYRSATRLREVGRLHCDDGAVETLDVLFPTEKVVLHEGF